ncbi:MAG: tyrosine-type recombinase/integrase [Chloroflexota bacterium]
MLKDQTTGQKAQSREQVKDTGKGYGLQSLMPGYGPVPRENQAGKASSMGQGHALKFPNAQTVAPHPVAADDVRNYIRDFLLEQKVRGNSPNTLRYYRANLERFVQFLESEGYPTDIHELRPGHVRHFFVYLSESEHRWNSNHVGANRKLSPGGVHGFARAVRALIKFVVAEANLQRSPMANVSMPAGRTEWTVEIFSEEEILRLFACIDKISRTPFTRLRNRAILSSLLESGCRAGELLTMSTATDWNSGLFQVTGKGNKTRTVAIGTFAIRELNNYARARQRVQTRSDALFIKSNGEPATYSTVREFFRDLRLGTGITHCHAHACRHTAFSRMLKQGMSIVHIKALAGHRSITTLERFYIATSPEDLKAEHEKYSPLDSMSRDLKRGGPTAAVELPPARRLLEEVRATSFRAVGRTYGVSDTTIRNRLKEVGLL